MSIIKPANVSSEDTNDIALKNAGVSSVFIILKMTEPIREITEGTNQHIVPIMVNSLGLFFIINTFL